MAMFQAPTRPNGQVHVELKAGKMDWDGKVVTADKKKGKVVLFTSDDDELMHFQWLDREKNETAIDLILFNDAYFQRIEKCTTGRMYLLRFTSSDKKLFFWMQEPQADGDSDLIKKFNDKVGATVAEKSSANAAGTAAAGAGASVGAGAAATPPVNPQLQAILQQFLAAQGGQAAGQAPAQSPPVLLGAVLTSDVLGSLMSDEEAVSELKSHLPAGQQSTEDLREALASPQIQQHLNSLTQAIHSDQLPILFASLGLDSSSIVSQPGADALEILCRATEKKEAGGS